MMTRAKRRYARIKKVKQRLRVITEGGYACGSLCEKHVDKIKENGGGYMSKHGSLLHYARGTEPVSEKVRDRKSYNGTMNWSYRDKKRIVSMNDELKEITGYE